jgi:hypothetical protein
MFVCLIGEKEVVRAASFCFMQACGRDGAKKKWAVYRPFFVGGIMYVCGRENHLAHSKWGV